MSEDEKTGEVDDEPEETTESADGQAEGKPAETDTPKEDDEQEHKESVEEELKANATDKGKAQRLARQTRVRAEGVWSLVPEMRATNIFVGDIGLVDAGGHRPADATRGGVVTGSVTDDTLRQVAATFVAPDSYDRLLAQLRQ